MYADNIPTSWENAAVEDIDETFCEIDELLERCDHHLSFDDLRLVERYVKGELLFSLDAIVTCLPEPVQFHIVLKGKKGVASRFTNGCLPKSAVAVWDGRFLDVIPEEAAGCRKPPVLIHDVQGMEGVNQLIPSTVWLEPAHELDCFVGGPLYFSNSLGFKMFPTVANRELCVVVGGVPIFEHELVGKEIKRGTKIMNDVPRNRAEHLRDILINMNPTNLLSGLRIEFSDDSIWTSVKIPTGLGVEIRQVFFGPFNLYPSADKRFGIS